MGRKPRIQFPGALYHVFSRGNYRQNIFETTGASHAFEQCLFEACDLSGWLIHAHTVMTNHFHIALETPRANLAKGMHWLQSTYSKRFNCFRHEKGHLFQSRYRALLIEPGMPLACVVNYIHLNPVRAKLSTVDNLEDFQWSSYRRFLSGSRPSFLVCRQWLDTLGFTDTAAGWGRYRDYLAWLATSPSEQKAQLFQKLCSDWAIGSEPWKHEITSSERGLLTKNQLNNAAHPELRELGWIQTLDDLLSAAGQSREKAAAALKGASWKIAIARELRHQTSATNAWIAEKLHMGSPQSVSVYLSKKIHRFKN